MNNARIVIVNVAISRYIIWSYEQFIDLTFRVRMCFFYYIPVYQVDANIYTTIYMSCNFVMITPLQIG